MKKKNITSGSFKILNRGLTLTSQYDILSIFTVIR